MKILEVQQACEREAAQPSYNCLMLQEACKNTMNKLAIFNYLFHDNKHTVIYF